MVPSAWRPFFTFNQYSQIGARALRNALKEQPRLAAERHGVTTLRYQKWEAGKGGQQIFLNQADEK